MVDSEIILKHHKYILNPTNRYTTHRYTAMKQIESNLSTFCNTVLYGLIIIVAVPITVILSELVIYTFW